MICVLRGCRLLCLLSEAMGVVKDVWILDLLAALMI